MRALVVAILAASSIAAADTQLEATARLGVNWSSLYNENLDSPAEGYGPVLGLELGFVLEHFHPSIVVDLGQYTGNVNDFETTYAVRERVGHLAAKLRIDIVAGFDISAFVGGTLDLEHIDGNDRHTFGTMYGLGVGMIVWHDAKQAVRLDLSVSRSQFSPDGDDIELTQLGGSAGYTIKF